MTRVVLGLGSNLGSRMSNLQMAVERLEACPGVTVERLSSVYDTEPVGPPQPRYLNAAILVRTELSIEELWTEIQEIEAALGRERTIRWGPRTIDVDVLWAEAHSGRFGDLIVPHPRLEDRAFALAPLVDVLGEPPSGLKEALRRLGGAPPRWSASLRAGGAG